MVEGKGNSGLLTTLEANWQAEMEDRVTYQGFAARELNARRRNVMRGLAATKKHHAETALAFLPRKILRQLRSCVSSRWPRFPAR